MHLNKNTNVELFMMFTFLKHEANIVFVHSSLERYFVVNGVFAGKF